MNVNVSTLGIGDLHLAARAGDAERCLALLASGAAVDAVDLAGCTALMAASAGGHLQTVDGLIESGADVDRAAFDGATALHFAAAHGQAAVARRLLQAGADTRRQMGPPPPYSWGVQHYWTAMDVAAGNADGAMMDTLVEHGAQVTDQAVALLVHRRYVELGRCPTLHRRGHTQSELLGDDAWLYPDELAVGQPFVIPDLPACFHGRVGALSDRLSVLCRGDSDGSGSMVEFVPEGRGKPRDTALGPRFLHVHDWRRLGGTPMLQQVLVDGAELDLGGLLCLCAGGGKLPLVAALLALGARPGVGDLDPVSMATYHKHHDVVLLLSRQSAQGLARALCGAAGSHDVRTVDSLLQQGANVHVEHAGNTALGHCLRFGGHAETIRLLLSAGASPAATSWGTPVLVRSAELGTPDAVQALLDGGADANATGSKSETALHAAVRRNQKDTVRLLLAAGANPNARMRGRRMPLHVAADAWPAVDGDIVQQLVACGARIDARDGRGLTPLLATLAKGLNTPVFEALLQHGADPRATDRKKQTGLMLCAQAHGNALDVIGPLLEAGVDLDARGPKGETAVMMACRSRNEHAMGALIAAGADLSLRNDAGESLLAIARARRCSPYWLSKIEAAAGLPSPIG